MVRLIPTRLVLLTDYNASILEMGKGLRKDETKKETFKMCLQGIFFEHSANCHHLRFQKESNGSS